MQIIEKNADELFELFHFIQKIETDKSFKEIADNKFFADEGPSATDDMCFFHIERLSYDDDYPKKEAFENVLNLLDNEAYNFVYVLSGTSQSVDLYIGVVKNHHQNEKNLSTVNYGSIIGNAFEGNFNGSILKRMDAEQIQDTFINQVKNYRFAGVISGIPSINDNDADERLGFQGIDRLINSMIGTNWRMAVVCEPVSQREILKVKDDIYELYNRLSVYSRVSLQKSSNSTEGISFGRNVSQSESQSHSWNESDSRMKGSTWDDGKNNASKTRQVGTGGGSSQNSGHGENWGYNRNHGTSEAVTIEIANKYAQDIMQYIDDELLPRIKRGYGRGMFKTTLYYMGDKRTTSDRLKLSIMALFQGEKSTFSPLLSQDFDLKDNQIRKNLYLYQNCYYQMKEYSLDAATLLSRPVDSENGLGVSTYLTADEACILAGLPQKEVPGIVLSEGVEFGLNEHFVKKEEAITLGNLVQKGRTLNIPVSLKKDSMMKHTFVAGVTGSGKTTTCYKLLSAAQIPFLVIEPAKTEYRSLVEQKDIGQVYVFTLGNESIAPFRINPFEIVDGEVISAHIDMLKATFTSAFPMEASMPQILEEAIIRCYEDKGWSIDTNTNNLYTDPFGYDKEKSFPIMSELLDKMRLIVKEKSFSPQMQADYEGSLVSRLSNLAVGAKGRMLNCPYSIDFQFLAEHNVIIEMEELKSPEDKALFMGFILSRLTAVIKMKHKKNKRFRHLTLIEEAHRLLAKTDYTDNGSKRTAVETFTDLLAEVRKYGEGLIVVDQIPNKLAPEVLKNTNTKIIHKILARDDKETVGDTMLMNDKQKEYLSALKVGHAIVFSENMDKPVHVFIQKVTGNEQGNNKENEISDEKIRELFSENRSDFGNIYDDLEILPYYESFQEVMTAIARRTIDKTGFEKTKKMILEIVRQTGQQEQAVWEQIIKRRERLRGNLSQMNAEEQKYIKKMAAFLNEVFRKPSFESLTLELIDFRICMELL